MRTEVESIIAVVGSTHAHMLQCYLSPAFLTSTPITSVEDLAMAAVQSIEAVGVIIVAPNTGKPDLGASTALVDNPA